MERKILVAMMVFFALAPLNGCGSAAPEEARTLTIFAAASLHDVVSDFVAAYEMVEGDGALSVTLNFAGSNVLAQQIHAAPSADLFLSADEDWVRFLEAKASIVAGSARPFLGNRLVVVARPDAVFADAPWTGLDRVAGENVRHLVLADPEAVPAGRYAKAYLQSGDPPLWGALKDRVIPALDVRAALQLVASDPLHAGIVYRTDAMASSKVTILYELPALDGAPIVYWSALVSGGGGGEAAKDFLAFLDGEDAAAIRERHGFLAPTAP